MSLLNIIHSKRIKSGYPVLDGDDDHYFHPRFFKKKIIYSSVNDKRIFFIDKRHHLYYYGYSLNDDDIYYSSEQFDNLINNTPRRILIEKERIIKVICQDFGIFSPGINLFLSNRGNLYGIGNNELLRKLDSSIEENITIPTKLKLDDKIKDFYYSRGNIVLITRKNKMIIYYFKDSEILIYEEKVIIKENINYKKINIYGNNIYLLNKKGDLYKINDNEEELLVSNVKDINGRIILSRDNNIYILPLIKKRIFYCDYSPEALNQLKESTTVDFLVFDKIIYDGKRLLYTMGFVKTFIKIKTNKIKRVKRIINGHLIEGFNNIIYDIYHFDEDYDFNDDFNKMFKLNYQKKIIKGYCNFDSMNVLLIK